MMPPVSGPTPPVSGPTPPVTLWQAPPDSPYSGKWLALIELRNLRTCMIRDTREQALTDMTAWWAAERKDT